MGRNLFVVFAFFAVLGGPVALATADSPEALGDVRAVFLYDLETTAVADLIDGDLEDCAFTGATISFATCNLTGASLVWTGPKGTTVTVPMDEVRYFKPEGVPWREYVFSGVITQTVQGIDVLNPVSFRIVQGVKDAATMHGTLTLGAVGETFGFRAVPLPVAP